MAGLVAIFAGCASEDFPRPTNRGFPADWPDLVPVGDAYAELNGTYLNDGIAITPGKGQSPISLASLIPAQPDSQWPARHEKFTHARELGLKVVSRREGEAEVHGLTFIVATDGQKEGVWTRASCYRRGEGYVASYDLKQAMVGVPMVVYRLKDWTVTLAVAADHSLVAEISETAVGMSVVVPYYSSSTVWARFRRAGD